MTTGQPHPHRPPGLRYPPDHWFRAAQPPGGPGSAEFASARLSARNGKTERRRSALSRRFAAQPPINSPNGAPAVSLQEFVCAAPNVAFCAEADDAGGNADLRCRP